MLLSPVIRSPTYSELFLHVSNAISLMSPSPATRPMTPDSRMGRSSLPSPARTDPSLLALILISCQYVRLGHLCILSQVSSLVEYIYVRLGVLVVLCYEIIWEVSKFPVLIVCQYVRESLVTAKMVFGF
jgi:hypothetical protein